MQLHELKSTHRLKKKKRVGRGGKRGTYSGRGVKGQKARAGAKIRPASRDLLKQIPKRRGFKFKSLTNKPAIVSFNVLAEKFSNGALITPKVLLEKGLIRKIKGKMPEVKILGGVDALKKFIIEDCQVSSAVAQRMIQP